MRTARARASIALTTVVTLALVGALLVGVAPTGAQEVEDCFPTCTRPEPSPSPSPSPSPEPEPDESPPPPPPGGGGSTGGGSTGGGSTGGGGGTGGGAGGPGGSADTGDGHAPGGGGQGGAPGDSGQTGSAGPAFDLPFAFGGPMTSERLLTLLRGLEDSAGIPVRRSILQVVGPFPVAGPAWWTNDWHACRDGCTRFHEGLDIFAPRGTPLVAVADGVVTQKGTGSLSGLHVEMEDANGTQYFYAHLDRWVDGLAAGQRVEVGDVLGYVGNTGNAITTPPHVHFELQPGGVPVPPKPHVDRWLSLAEERAAALAGVKVGTVPPVGKTAPDFRLTQSINLGPAAQGEPAGGVEGLLLASGLQPGATLEVTNGTLERMTWEIVWREQSEQEFFETLDDYAQQVAFEHLLPVSLTGKAHEDGHD